MVSIGDLVKLLDLGEKLRNYLAGLTDRSLRKKGIIDFHEERDNLTPDWWTNYFCKRERPNKVIIMGQSLEKTFKNRMQADIFVNWCNSGLTKIKVLMLSPEGTEVTQVQTISKDISYKNNNDPNSVLKEKILDVVNILQSRIIDKIPTNENKPLVRYATVDMPFSLVCIDDDMVITLYGVESEGNKRPTLLIKGKETPAYRVFYSEYEQIWKKYSKVNPYEDPILRQYRKRWLDYIPLHNFDSPLTAPLQAIIYPTYGCSESCSYCMYRFVRKEYCKGSENEIDFEALKKLIESLLSMGVKNIEISGGGEPSEYSSFAILIEYLSNINSKKSWCKFGLLTNGSNIGQFDQNNLLLAFNDYIRFSRHESTTSESRTDNETFHNWRVNLNKLLIAKRRNNSIRTTIGIKYLLPNGVDSGEFIEMIHDDLQDNIISGVNHLRFKSDRRVSQDLSAFVEQQIFYLLKQKDLFKESKEISLSLTKTTYPENFRCWLSPMNVLIDPSEDVYICCNYSEDRNEKCIGSLRSNSLAEIWNSEKHTRIRKGIRANNCNKDSYCNCRYAELQSRLDKLVPFFTE